MPRTKKTATTRGAKSLSARLTMKANNPIPKEKARRSTKGGDVTTKGATAEKKSPRNKGLHTGMKIMEYQDHTLSINYKSDRRLSETALAADWAAEFPQSDCMQRQDVKTVGSVRRLYNNGRHTKAQGGVKPERQSVPYGPDGKPVVKESKKDATAKAA